MLDRLESEIGVYRNALNLQDKRQQILAANIANSDTPRYQARDIDFSVELSNALSQENTAKNVPLKTTEVGHMQSNNVTTSEQNILYRIPYQASADGNTVEMDQERAKFIDNSIRYQGSLTFLGEQFKNLMSVLKDGV